MKTRIATLTLTVALAILALAPAPASAQIFFPGLACFKIDTPAPTIKATFEIYTKFNDHFPGCKISQGYLLNCVPALNTTMTMVGDDGPTHTLNCYNVDCGPSLPPNFYDGTDEFGYHYGGKLNPPKMYCSSTDDQY